LKCIQNFGGESRRKYTTRKINHVREDNVNVDVKDIVWECVERIDVAQCRSVCYKRTSERSVSICLEFLG
jgi:hypothetical protein